MDLKRLRSQIIGHEGTGPIVDGRLMPYTDTVGKVTIGYGRNLTDRGLSRAEAEMLLANDINDTLRALEKFAWWAKLNDVRRRAIGDMVFNLGLPGFLGFHGMLAALARDDYETAAVCGLNSLWLRQVGQRARDDMEMLRSGEDQP